jgi:hypothetical protein
MTTILSQFTLTVTVTVFMNPIQHSRDRSLIHYVGLGSQDIGIETFLHFVRCRITFVHNPYSKCTPLCHHTNASDIMFLYHESDTAHLVLKTNSWQEYIQISGAFGESKTCLQYCFKFRSSDRSPYTK